MRDDNVRFGDGPKRLRIGYPAADEPDVSALDRTRAEYSGIDLNDEFQPVDEVELAEEGMLLDDAEQSRSRPVER